jgi:hypothetical protein
MPKLTGTRTYTVAQMAKLHTAFSFLNQDASDATDRQIADWIDQQVEAKWQRHVERIEGAKADDAVSVGVAAL